MSQIARRIRVGFVAVLCALVGAFPVFATAATTPPPVLSYAETPAVIITEFQTNGGGAANEFIELYNTTDADIILGGSGISDADQWKLQFFNSASAKTGAPVWTTALSASNSIDLTGTIPAHGYFLVASIDYMPGGEQPNMSYSASSSHLMTDTGGALQLLQSNAVTADITAHDRVMWLAQSGATSLPEGVLASPSNGKSLQRIPNEDEEYFDEDSSLANFGQEDTITPHGPWQMPVAAEPEPMPNDTPSTGASTNAGSADSDTPEDVANPGLVPPEISELLPNPASPLTDADDEFIELYNANTSAFDLEGYKLEVGTTTIRTYTFPAGSVMVPLSYQAFMSADTGLSLTNNGGQARLRDPASQLLSESMIYADADDNAAWIETDGIWQWTTTATPGVANILTLPIAKAASASKSSAKTTKAAATKKTATKAKAAAKPKAAKAKKAKSTKKKATQTAAVAATLPAKPKPPIHVGILVAVVVVAVLYGLYEYRHDIALKFKQLGRNRNNSVQHRLATAGR